MGSIPETYNDPLVGVYRPVLLIQTQKCHFAHPFSDLAPKTLCHHYLDKKSNNKKKFLKSHFEFACFSIFLTYLELKR